MSPRGRDGNVGAMLEPRTLEPGVRALVPGRLEHAGFWVAFTERSGGVSEGPFASLNLGLRAGDDPGRAQENRRRLASAMGLEAFAVGRQVHGTRVGRVGARRAGAGFADPADAFPGTDALTTARPGVGVAVLTADCVPVALGDPGTGRVSVIHAGWRGTAAGVIGAALRAFPDPARLLAAVGPAIGPDHYEVGREVLEAVNGPAGGTAVARGRGPKVRLDLPATVVGLLRAAGVREVEWDAALCTACAPDRFFSYRRDGRTGRQGVVAVRRR